MYNCLRKFLVKPEPKRNLSNKKYSAAKDKSPLIKTDQFKNNRIPLQNLDEKPKVQDMTQKKLELENNKLKVQIKLLTEQLLRQGVRIKDLKQSNKKTVPREQSTDDKIRNIDRELSNTNKVFTQIEEEHQKLKQKLDRIKDPQHIFDLEKEVAETLQQIEDMKKENKKLALAAKNSGKALEKREMVADSSDLSKEIDLKSKEGIALLAKLEKLEEKNANFEENHAAKMAKLSQLQEGYQQLLETNKGVVETEQDSEKIARYNNLKKKAELEEMKLKDARKKFYLKIQAEKELDELYQKNCQIQEELTAFIEMIVDQQANIRSLSGKEMPAFDEMNRSDSYKHSHKKPVKDLSVKSTLLANVEPSSVNDLEYHIPTSARNIKPPLYKRSRKESNEFSSAEKSAVGTSKHRILIGKLKDRRRDNMSPGQVTFSQEVSSRVESKNATENEILSALKSKGEQEIKDKQDNEGGQIETLENKNEQVEIKKDEIALSSTSNQVSEDAEVVKETLLGDSKTNEPEKEIQQSHIPQSTEVKADKPEKRDEISFGNRSRLNRARRGTPNELDRENLNMKPVDLTDKKEQNPVKNETGDKIRESVEEVSLKNTITSSLYNQKENLQLEPKPANKSRNRAHLFEEPEVKQDSLNKENVIEQKQEEMLKEATPINFGGFGKGRDLNVNKQNDWNREDLSLKKPTLINDQENYKAKENPEIEKRGIGRMKQRGSFDKKVVFYFFQS